LIGGYALTRIGPAGERWLLVKEADEYAGRTRDPVRSQPESVKTGPRQRRTDRVKGMCVLPNAQAASSSARLIMGRPGPPAFITMIIIFAGKGVAIEVPYQDHASNSDKPSSWWPRDHAASRSHGPLVAFQTVLADRRDHRLGARGCRLNPGMTAPCRPKPARTGAGTGE